MSILSYIKKFFWGTPPSCHVMALELLAKVGYTEPDIIVSTDPDCTDGAVSLPEGKPILYLPWPIQTLDQLYVVAHEVGHLKQIQYNREIFLNAPVKLLELEAEIMAHLYFERKGLRVSSSMTEMTKSGLDLYLETSALEGSNRMMKARMYRAYREIKSQVEAWIHDEDNNITMPRYNLLTVSVEDLSF